MRYFFVQQPSNNGAMIIPELVWLAPFEGRGCNMQMQTERTLRAKASHDATVIVYYERLLCKTSIRELTTWTWTGIAIGYDVVCSQILMAESKMPARTKVERRQRHKIMAQKGARAATRG